MPAHRPEPSSALRYPVWGLVLAILVLGAGIGLRDPSPPDEPRFVLAAQQMIASGDWLVPHRGSEIYAQKPPPFMWAQACAYLLTGSWRIAFLLPSLVAAVVTLWLTWDIARRLWNERIACCAAVALLVTLQFGLQAKRAQIDMMLVALTTMSLWALLRAHWEGDRRGLWGLGGLAAGIGTVTKGVGFLPLLVLLPGRMAARYAGRKAHPPTAPGAAGTGLLLLGFVAGAAVWLLPLLIGVARSDDPELHAYLSEILFRQTAGRYANPWHHQQPAWYYLQVILTLWLPGALLLPWLLPAWWRRCRRGDSRQIMLLGWTVLVLLFFSASPAKREVYIFPALPAVCVAAAPLVPGLLRLRGVQRMLAAYLLLLSLLMVSAGLLGCLGWGRWPERLLADPQFEVADVAAVWRWFALIGAAGLLATLAWPRRRIARALLLFTSVLWVAYGIGLMPALNPASSSRGLMQRVGATIGPDGELGLIGWREQQMLQADRPAREFGFERPWQSQWPDAARWLRTAPTQRWLLVEKTLLSRCVDPLRAMPAGRANRRDWLLVRSDALRAYCSFELPDDVGHADDDTD